MGFIKALAKVFGSRNERLLKHYRQQVKKINALEPSLADLSDEALKAKTAEFKSRLEAGTKLDALLPEAFAVVREAAKRQLKQRHYDVQLIGGMSMHEGKIAEMRTGEGKTLVATLPIYLNALTGKGVHLITVNDYLAKRDAHWMLPIYTALDLTVGVIVHGMSQEEKMAAYNADITYGTNNEFGFDYLRDNMAFTMAERVQRPLNFAVIDEVDSILIDEARTPLIISGADEDSSELYKKINKLVPRLTMQKEKDAPGDYSIDEKNKQAFMTEDGQQKIEDIFVKEGLLGEGDSLYNPTNMMLMHHLNAALRANALFKKDVEYIVKDDQVVIVDEHTGRTMEGRRWSDGLHQAIEAKEGVKIQNENQTLASITFQNYFRLYQKLAGMTGTADTEAFEFQQIYGLEVVVIPTNKPSQRFDHQDKIYLTLEEKFNAIVEDIEDCLERQQPVLVGTVSIETSEFLSSLLKKKNIPHNVLNAKFHEQEAHIVAQAGRPRAVTIATNMAGRGTDIVLGGNLEQSLKEKFGEDASQYEQAKVLAMKADWTKCHAKVLEAGGLRIIGTERHESRRIDNQLRGRSGRQGDPGSTQFYLSLKDNLMRIFFSDKISTLLKRLGGLEKGEPISHGLVSRSIENAQRKVEGHNFDMRKQLLEFDDVANDQRRVIYQKRDELLEAEDISDNIEALFNDVLHSVLNEYIPLHSLAEAWDIKGLETCLSSEFGLSLPIAQWLSSDDTLYEENLKDKIIGIVEKAYKEKEALVGDEKMRKLEKNIMLHTVDTQWKEHLATMDYLRQGIHLRGFAQKDPKQEYKREAFELFTQMLDSIKREVISILTKIELKFSDEMDQLDQSFQSTPMHLEFQHAEASALGGHMPSEPEGQPEKHTPFKRHLPKVGRNDTCPCGSGRKFKQCHGALV